MKTYSLIPKEAYQGLLGNASATLYTAPAAQTNAFALTPPKSMLTEVIIANTDTVTHTVTLYKVPSGGSAGDATTIIPGESFPPKSSTTRRYASMIEAAGTIRGFADTANKVTLTVTVVDMVPRI